MKSSHHGSMNIIGPIMWSNKIWKVDGHYDSFDKNSWREIPLLSYMNRMFVEGPINAIMSSISLIIRLNGIWKVAGLYNSFDINCRW